MTKTEQIFPAEFKIQLPAKDLSNIFRLDSQSCRHVREISSPALLPGADLRERLKSSISIYQKGPFFLLQRIN